MYVYIHVYAVVSTQTHMCVCVCVCVYVREHDTRQTWTDVDSSDTNGKGCEYISRGVGEVRRTRVTVVQEPSVSLNLFTSPLPFPINNTETEPRDFVELLHNPFSRLVTQCFRVERTVGPTFTLPDSVRDTECGY